MTTYKNDVTGIVPKENAIEGIADQGRGVVGKSVDDYGIRAHSTHSSGLRGSSDHGTGVEGGSTNHYGVAGMSQKVAGVRGTSTDGPGVEGQSTNHYGVAGMSQKAAGVRGSSTDGWGVEGGSTNAYGVAGMSEKSAGVRGTSTKGPGVEGWSTSGEGVSGFSKESDGIVGTTKDAGAVGVFGRNAGKGVGILAEGVVGLVANGFDTDGLKDGGEGIRCSGGDYGIWAFSPRGRNRFGDDGYAGYFLGNVRVVGNLEKTGGGFKIDHPLDPANKYLSHSFVESPDRTNMYDGTAVLDAKGEAAIALPDWFEHLNHNFRYQLTAVGSPAPNLHVAAKIKNGKFKMSGGKPGMEVCWQITGIRKDPWALNNPLHLEETKNDAERGNYLHPKLYGQPESSTIGRREEHHTPRTGK